MSNSRNYVLLAIFAIVAFIALVFLLQPLETPNTKLGRSIDEMSDGIEEAADKPILNKTTTDKQEKAVKM